jgi:hypothetical protein
MSEKFWAVHDISGKVVEIDDATLNHPIFGAHYTKSDAKGCVACHLEEPSEVAETKKQTSKAAKRVAVEPEKED